MSEPQQQVVMYQNWHHLLFLHWEIPVADLQKMIPPGLTVDTFDGKAFVSLIPFTMTGVRPILLPPVPGVSNFHEINLRTYVHRNGADPGVWFFSLDASNMIAVEAARAAYKLPYFQAKIDFHEGSGPLPEIEFTSHREDPRGPMPAHAHIKYAPLEGPSFQPQTGSLDHFLIERYIFYSKDSDQNLYRTRVHHAPYTVQKADLRELDETIVWASGIRRPDSVPIRHYSREVNVKAYAIEKV